MARLRKTVSHVQSCSWMVFLAAASVLLFVLISVGLPQWIEHSWEKFIAWGMSLLTIVVFYLVWPKKNISEESSENDGPASEPSAKKKPKPDCGCGEFLRLKYQVFTEEIRGRGSDLLQLESITVAGSFVAIALAVDVLTRDRNLNVYWVVLVSVFVLLVSVLMGITAFMRRTTQRVNKLQLNKLTELEGILGEGCKKGDETIGHGWTHRKIKQDSWLRNRWNVWLFTLCFLAAFYMILAVVMPILTVFPHAL